MEAILQAKVLFSRNATPYAADRIRREISNFGKGYNKTVIQVIDRSRLEVGRDVFLKNIAILMPNFLMTRSGPFRGVRYNKEKGQVIGEEKIEPFWKTAGAKITALKGFLSSRYPSCYQRVLVDMKATDQEKVANDLWGIFKTLLPQCMGKSTLGLVAASKILFSVFPEVALPVDNTQWRAVFKTVDYGDIIRHMACEIMLWEKRRCQHLEECLPDNFKRMTLPAIYNVMAMKARYG